MDCCVLFAQATVASLEWQGTSRCPCLRYYDHIERDGSVPENECADFIMMIILLPTACLLCSPGTYGSTPNVPKMHSQRETSHVYAIYLMVRHRSVLALDLFRS